MFARGLLAPAYASLGNVSEARAEAEKAVTLAQTLDDTESLSHYQGLLQQLSVVAMSEDAVDAAIERATQAFERGDSATAESELGVILVAAVAHQRLELEATARGMLAQALLMRAAADDARPHLLRAHEIAITMQDEGATQHFAAILAQIATPEGADRLRQDAEAARRGDEVARQAGAAMEAGDFDLAQSLLEPAVSEAEAAGTPETQASLRGMLAQAYLMGGKRELAAKEAKRAQAISLSLGSHEAAESFGQILQLAVGFVAPVAKG
jgi:tetratricopeptide (TPR) repeat protein